jgi:hypothetical protein
MPLSDITSNSPGPQADPLPSKRGEIGYIEVAEPPTAILHTFNARDLTTRHPVDRDHSSDAVNLGPLPQSEGPAQPPTTASITKSYGILDLFKPQGPPVFGGLRLFTLGLFALQLVLLGGTVTIWVFTTRHITQSLSGHSTIIPFHIIFVIVVLIELVSLEHLLFRLRGERYSYVHPGEILPRHRNMPRSSGSLSFAPWNRPPLPTYAAVLSQSGVGTGDVEDHLIAYSPPPAYGNTRGSTLILTGFLRNSLGAPSSREFRTNRPLSHVSRDEQVDQAQNAWERQLEETMNRLEPPSAALVAG